MRTIILVSLLLTFSSVILGLSSSNLTATEINRVDIDSFSNTSHIQRETFPPVNVTITAGGGDVTISWTHAANAFTYIVEASDSPTVGFENITSTGTLMSNADSVTWSSQAIAAYRFYRIKTVSNTIEEDMVLVSGGTFNNGVSNVTLSSFYLNKYELTQSEYQAVMGANPSYDYGVGDYFPVYNVNWFNAIEYCNRLSMGMGLTPCYSYLNYGTNPSNWPIGWNATDANHESVNCNWAATGYRLPTEAEWEFAAMGGNLTHGYLYSGGNNIDAVAWYYTNSDDATHHTGTKAQNELGLFDMSGNVWEWCWDKRNNFEDYPAGDQTNPHGVLYGNFRIVRGGCWIDDTEFCHVSYRYVNLATNSNEFIGFRVCRNVP